MFLKYLDFKRNWWKVKTHNTSPVITRALFFSASAFCNLERSHGGWRRILHCHIILLV